MTISNPVKTVILCGGQGTRIRDASETIPKPMLRIGDKPIIWHIMKGYSKFGINNFILCLGYKGWIIKEFFMNYSAMIGDITIDLGEQKSIHTDKPHSEKDWKVTLAETGENTQTGGRAIAIRRYVEKDDIFCLTYGDGVANVNIARLIDFHRSHGKIATVTAVRPPSRFGEMRMEGRLVSEFNEKPQSIEGFINGGFFVFDAKRIWNYLGEESNCILEREPLQKLVSDKELLAFEHTGFWQPMDTLREYLLLNELWNSGKAEWKTWE